MMVIMGLMHLMMIPKANMLETPKFGSLNLTFGGTTWFETANQLWMVVAKLRKNSLVNQQSQRWIIFETTNQYAGNNIHNIGLYANKVSICLNYLNCI